MLATEQRVNLKFCVLLHASRSKLLNMLERMYRKAKIKHGFTTGINIIVMAMRVPMTISAADDCQRRQMTKTERVRKLCEVTDGVLGR
jgi:hypothetical protein